MNDRDQTTELPEGPPHRSSVLGYTLFSLGMHPNRDGQTLLGVTRGRGISGILSGARPTIVGMMRDLEPYVDALARPMAETPAPQPFLQIAREWLPQAGQRARLIIDAEPGMLVHPSPMARVDILQRLDPFDALAELSDDDAWPRDAGSLFGACCRIVGWGRTEVMARLNTTNALARGMIDGKDIPQRDDWLRLFAAYDAEIADDLSPVGVGIRWALGNDTVREDIEWRYSDRGSDGLPVLFEERGE